MVDVTGALAHSKNSTVSSIAPYPQILCTGDSICQLGSQNGGYVAALAEMYCGKMDVVNRGFGGYNTRQLLKKLQDDLYVEKRDAHVRLITINIGTNDSSTAELAHVPLETYKQNIRDIITIFRLVHPEAKIVLLTPSTCDIRMWARFMELLKIPAASDEKPERDSVTLRVYADACLEIAREHEENGVVFGVDFWNPVTRALEEGSLLPEEIYTDGLHFTAKGYGLLSDALKACLKENLPSLDPVQLPDAFMWSVIYGNEGTPASKAILEKVKNKKLDLVAITEALRKENMEIVKAARGE